MLSGISSSLNSANANSLIPTRQPQQEKPVPLILDSEGRTVDSSGKEVQLTHLVPSLKVSLYVLLRTKFIHFPLLPILCHFFHLSLFKG